MKPSDLTFLKKVGLALCMGMILQTTAFGQCNNNLATRTYDTALTSTGFNMTSLSFPKWSPDSGLLVSVKMSAEVSSQYSFTLRNVDVQPATYQVSVGQEDQFVSPQLSSPFTNITTPQVIGSYPLAPGGSISQGPFTFLDHHVTSDSITAVAPFLGTDQVSISYMSFTFTTLSTYNNASYYYGASIANNMHFSLQYLYCKSSGVLAANLTRWTAELQDARTIQLDWSVVNEIPGRIYHIQRSTDGREFTDITTLPSKTGSSTQDYAWTDPLPENAAGNFYYRLQVNDNGTTTYSPVRQITLTSNSQSLKAYPNPATSYIDLTTGSTAPRNWQVEVFSASGSLIQRSTFLQAHTMHLVFRNAPAPGTYFARISDLRGQDHYTTSFIVTGRN